ncbi:hypothetical protein [Sandaracinus amylolyticus]|uniref:hypothetical protein n=1 Tax=Sandaracinus amylolyticus TaxID=927083 RepID=UPI001F363676|nr:hypothetical protein [Sandaracinus amylolyticus]UJR81439.1 Hypothetical protein I5071_34980 [Sandaracinus amylolyticus]
MTDLREKVVGALAACAWSHDGDDWSIDVGGACPVQGEGDVDGLPMYFRARGEGWSLRIAATPDGNPVAVGFPRADRESPPGWEAGGRYGAFPDAGWMPAEHSRAIVEACVRAFRAQRAARPATTEGTTIDVERVPTEPPPSEVGK